jgi:hypothetical protein
VPSCTRWRRFLIRPFSGDGEMPQLQERGAELAVELLEAADQVGHLLPDEIVALLREAAGILDGLLHRNLPTDDG